MEQYELNQDELVNIYGGNEVTEGLLYFLGAVTKGFVYFASGAKDGGYTYCKVGY